MARYRNGFPPFGSDDEDIVLRAALKTATADENGYSWGVMQSGAVAATDYSWNENGMALVNSVLPIRWILSGLAKGGFFSSQGNISFEVELAYFSNVPSATKYLWSTNRFYAQQTNVGTISQTFTQATSNSNTIQVSPIGKSTHVRVDITYKTGDAILFFDYLPMARININGWTGTVTDFYMQGLTSVSNSGHTNVRVRNLQISHRPQRYPPSGSILFLGDSITVQGNTNSLLIGGNHKNWWYPGYGFTAADAVAASGGYLDVGLQSTLFRELSRNGIWTNDNFNYAKSGGTAADALTKLNEFIAANKGKKPRVVLIGCGTNDIAQLIPEATTASTFQTLLTTIRNLGVEHVGCWTPPSLRNNPTYATTTYNNAHDAYNRVVETTNVTYCAAQGFPSDFYNVIPVFTGMGGHNFDPTRFQSADIHPNITGQYEIGMIEAPVTIRMFS